MMPMAVWDFPEERAKATGIARAESANWRNVQIAREIARELYLHHGAPVSADDVRVEMSSRFPDQTYGNWMGSVFRRSEWEPAGFTLSRTKGRHSNRLLTWRLKSVRQATEGAPR